MSYGEEEDALDGVYEEDPDCFDDTDEVKPDPDTGGSQSQTDTSEDANE